MSPHKSGHPDFGRSVADGLGIDTSEGPDFRGAPRSTCTDAGTNDAIPPAPTPMPVETTPS